MNEAVPSENPVSKAVQARPQIFDLKKTEKPAEILVIKLGALGDFIQALGPMAAIRRHHKQARITLLTTPPFENFARECGYFDQIWLDEKPRWYQFSAWARLRKRLNDAGFARVYDLQNNDRTAMYFKLLRQKPEWVGAARGASHRNDSKLRTAGHAFDGHMQTLALAGITDVAVDTLEWMKGNISNFPLRRPYVIFVPGSSPEHHYKRWPAANYGRLARLLQETGYQPVIIGTAAEQSASQIILKDCPGALDLTGQTSLPQVTILARGAAGAIGNDTGPMHLIAATGCPVLALLSKHSDAVRHRPKGGDVYVLQSPDLQGVKPEKVLKLFRPRELPPRNSTTTH
jgi:ADP-heptose:LPS heptosyltransferase